MESGLRKVVEERFLKGEIGVSKAAKILGVSLEEFARHVPHIKKVKKKQKTIDDYVEMLENIIDVLNERVMILVSEPIGEVSEGAIAKIVKELRGAIELFAKIKGEIQTAPQVTVNVMVLNKITDLLLKEAPKELREKVIKILEESKWQGDYNV